jgi:hypothetical protein
MKNAGPNRSKKYFFADLIFQGLMTNVSSIPMVVVKAIPS